MSVRTPRRGPLYTGWARPRRRCGVPVALCFAWSCFCSICLCCPVWVCEGRLHRPKLGGAVATRQTRAPSIFHLPPLAFHLPCPPEHRQGSSGFWPSGFRLPTSGRPDAINPSLALVRSPPSPPPLAPRPRPCLTPVCLPRSPGHRQSASGIRGVGSGPGSGPGSIAL